MGTTARTLLAAVAALAVLSVHNAHAGPVNVPCETLTRLDYCTECSKPPGAAAHLCFLCQPTRASIWRADGSLSEVVPVFISYWVLCWFDWPAPSLVPIACTGLPLPAAAQRATSTTCRQLDRWPQT